jgi:membrane dipeptidase
MLIADSHLDLAYSAMGSNRDLRRSIEEIRAAEVASGSTKKGAGRNTVSLPAMAAANVFLCFATANARITLPGNNRPDAWRSPQQAYAAAMGDVSLYRVWEAEGWVRHIRDAGTLDAHVAEWQAWHAQQTGARPPIGYVLCIEGADPIVGPWQLETWWHAGLRIVSLVHYWFNQYAYGNKTSGRGLLPAGRELLKEMDRLGILLDVTHLSDNSFWEAVDIYGGPILATHNCCRALTPHDRQFTDEQIVRIAQRGGVIGVAMDDWMLVPDWKEEPGSNERVSMEDVVNHIDHICQLAGNADHAAIGSDLDGGYGTEQTPGDLETIADLHKIAQILRRRGYAEEDVNKVMHGNWVRFLQQAWA